MEKRAPFEYQFARVLSNKLQSAGEDSLHIEIGFYCNRDPRALLYYLEHYLSKEGKTGIKFEIKKLSEEFCWQRCFKGFPIGGELPQCKNCIVAVFPSYIKEVKV